VLIITLLLGFSNKFSGVNYTPAKQQSSFLAPLSGRKKIFAREVSHFQSFTFYCFALLDFCLHWFIKNTKKLVPL
jgi:hypothetical protein